MKPGYPTALAVMVLMYAGYRFLWHLKPEPEPSPLHKSFLQWKADHNVSISFGEESFRMKIFAHNLELINTHNKNTSAKYQLGLNKFAHMTLIEFSALHFGYAKARFHIENATHNHTGKIPDAFNLTVPDEIDWQAQGKVSKVKDQLQCGSCYATTALDTIESVLAMTIGEVYDLSVQEIIDCSNDYGNMGCNGGYMTYVYNYVVDHGVVLESDYPYTGQVGTCNIPEEGTKTIISGYRNVTSNSFDALKSAVAKNPVAIALMASSPAFQFYKSGIITHDACDVQVDHSSTIIGYGNQNGTLFWKVKNSWGESWGDKGYVYIERTDGAGTCGINTEPSYPTDYC